MLTMIIERSCPELDQSFSLSSETSITQGQARIDQFFPRPLPHRERTMASTPAPAVPTIQTLGISPPKDIDPVKVAGEWLEKLQTTVSPSSDGDIDVDKVLDLFQPDAFWRDILSLTWDFRTFFGAAQIKTFLQDRIANPSLGDKTRLNNLKLESATVEKPWEEIEWIEALFTFSVGTWGAGDGVFRLVYSPEGVWKGYTIYTNLQSLSDHPEKVGALRNPFPNHGKWVEQREKEIEFEGVEPYVVVIGGGQSGLDVGARLKFLDIPTLIVEKYPRVGDQWRNRYQALCLHDPVCELHSLCEYSTYKRHSSQGTTTCPTYRTCTAVVLRTSTLIIAQISSELACMDPCTKGTRGRFNTSEPFLNPLNSWQIGSNPTPSPWSSTSGPLQPSHLPGRTPPERGS